MQTTPVLQIVWLHRRAFLAVMCLAFLVLALAIFIVPLPKRVTVRSSIEIGSTVINEKQEPFEPAEHIARRIYNVYGPAALLAMASRGISPSSLSALQDPSVDSIGRTVVMISTIDPLNENEAKVFHETTADLVTKELAPRARALRQDISARIDLATRIFDSLEQQILTDGKEIERIGTLSDDLRDQLQTQRTTLAALYQRTGATLQSGDSSMVEARIRELQEQISSQNALIGNLALERSRLTRELATTRRQSETQAKTIADAKFEQSSFIETHISLPPSLMPVRPASRRLSLLMVALAASVLIAFGTVALLHKVAKERS